MKLLTELGDEQCLVQMHRAEMAALVVLGAIANVHVEGQAAPTAAPEPTAPVRATDKPHKGILANGSRQATCVECGKSFKRKTCEKVCSRACRVARERKYKARWDENRKQRKAVPVPTVPARRVPARNPSDPAMTPEERTELIKQRAAVLGALA